MKQNIIINKKPQASNSKELLTDADHFNLVTLTFQ